MAILWLRAIPPTVLPRGRSHESGAATPMFSWTLEDAGSGVHPGGDAMFLVNGACNRALSQTRYYANP